MSDLIGQTLGQYQIVSVLGEGGMATVYRAHQTSIKRDVAIKVIESKLARNPEFIKRFEREAQTIASLDHPHILKIFDFGQQGDLLYLVMELKAGGTLPKLIGAQPLSLERISALLTQIASALDYAHGRGIIHRDLKPQNVLLDEQGNAFLTDFGVAKLMQTDQTSLTHTGTVMGTPTYMSPEQWQGRGLDARSDLYSLGIMLYEMLTGQTPFHADTPASMMFAHLQQTPPPLRDLRSDLPRYLDPIIAKALAKSPDERFQTAKALADTFRDAINGKPFATPSKSSNPVVVNAQSLASPTARRLPLVIAAAIIAVFIIGGLILTSQRSPDNTPTSISASSTPVTQIAAIVSSTPEATNNAQSAMNTYIAQTLNAATSANTPTSTLTSTLTASPSSTSTASWTPSRTPTATITLDIAEIVASLDAQATADLRLTNRAATSTAIIGKTLTATSWTKTPTVTLSATPNITASVVAFLTQRAVLTGTVEAHRNETLTSTAWTFTPTQTLPPTATSTLAASTLLAQAKTNLITLNGGSFSMGTDLTEATRAVEDCVDRDGGNCESSYAEDSFPAHQVSISPFAIEKYEVTTEQYVAFLNSLGPNRHLSGCNGSGCAAVLSQQQFSHVRFDGTTYAVDTPLFNDRPIIFVTWNGADAYCRAIGRRLPTEAEWEFAARGGSAQNIYPWGNVWDPKQDPNRALTSRSRADNHLGPSEVTAFPTGATSTGIFNMAGNVSEWVADWYDANYYATAPFNGVDPQGPASSPSFHKVLRGGDWDALPFYARTVHRRDADPTDARATLGFRCASDEGIQASTVPQVTPTSASSSTQFPKLIPSQTSVPSRTPIPTRTLVPRSQEPTVCPPLQPATLVIESIPATTTDQTIQLTVNTSTGESYESLIVSSEGGQFSLQAGQPIIVPLVPNMTNHLTVTATFPTINVNGCDYPAYQATANTDKRGAPLQITQQASSTPTEIPTSTPLPVSSIPGRIIFKSNRDGSTNLYAIANGSSEIQKLTQSAINPFAYEVSPDAQHLAILTNAAQMDIVITNIDGTNANQIATVNSFISNEAVYVTWAPDGKQIAYETDGVIHLINADGSNDQSITKDTVCFSPRWSPDGTKLTFACSAGFGVTTSEIYVYNSAGKQARRITNLKLWSDAPYWSPDGKTIVFTAGVINSGIYDIYTVVLNGTGGTAPKKLTTNKVANYNPRFSPDGKYISYILGGYPNFELYVMSIDGKTKTKLASQALGQVWSPDGQYLAYVSLALTKREIFIMKLDDSSLVSLTNDLDADDDNPIWFPN